MYSILRYFWTVPVGAGGEGSGKNATEAATALDGWDYLVAKLKALILTSFDLRVLQYEEDIKEKEDQRLYLVRTMPIFLSDSDLRPKFTPWPTRHPT